MDFLNSLFGQNMSTPMKLFIMLLIALVVIGLLVMLASLLRGRGVSLSRGNRGRQPRLAVLDYADVDNRRRLVLIRRDNVEHLIMIGGTTELVVEQNIVRGVPVSALREPSVLRDAQLDPPPAPVDFSAPDNTREDPLGPREAARKAAGIMPQTHSQPVKPVDPFFDSPAPPAPVVSVVAEPTPRPVPFPPRPLPASKGPEVKTETTKVELPKAQPANAEPAKGLATSIQPQTDRPLPNPLDVRPVTPIASKPTSATDSLAARLEQAMRRPLGLGRGEPAAQSTPTPVGPEAARADLSKAEPVKAELAPAVKNEPVPEAPKSAAPPLKMPDMTLPSLPKPAAPAAPPAAAAAAPAKAAPLTQAEKMVFDSLEEEMASLLGRSPKKAE